MAHRVTGSKFDRFMACRGSEFHPHVQSPPGKHADSGTAKHGWVLAGEEPAEEFAEQAKAIDASALPEGTSEVALAYNWREDTARVLGTNIGRAYPTDGDEVCLSIDRLGLTETHAENWDFKSGRATFEDARWQLTIGALAACRAYGKDNALIGLLHDIDGVLVRGTPRELGPLELAAAASEVFEALSAPPPPDVVEGPHCRYCPAFAACPAKPGLARSLTGMPELVLNDDSVPRILTALESGERVLKDVRAAVREFVSHRPVRLADGSTLAMQEVSRESIDATKARAVLTPALWDAAAEFKLTKSALTAAVKAAGCGTPASVLKELREAGAISTNTHLELKRLRPPKAAALPEDVQP